MKIYATAKPKGDVIATGVCALLSAIVIAVSVICTPKTLRTSGNTTLAVTTVIVDAGHGGVDGGASGADGTLEKDLNLQISQSLCRMLALAGYPVIAVRTDDVSIHDEAAKTIRQKKISDLHNRLALTENTPNSILVSIHQNSYVGGKAEGTQVFYSGNNPGSALLADAVQNAVAAQIQPDNHRVTKQAGSNIFLLYQTKVPAVMVECGFLSDAEDLALLKTETYRRRMAYAVFCGVASYLQEKNI